MTNATKTKKKGSKLKKFLGKTVKIVFEDDKGKDQEIVGVATKIKKNEETGAPELVIENSAQEGDFYTAGLGEFEVVEDAAEEETPDEEDVGESASDEEEKPTKKGKAKKHEEEVEQRYLDIESLKFPDPKDRPRKFLTDEEFGRLVNDMKDRGMDYPILVDSWDAPTVTDGINRVEAAKVLKWDKIRASLRPVKDKADRLWQGLLDNLMRREQHWLDTANAIIRLMKLDSEEYTGRKIGKRLGLSDSQVSRLLATTKLPAEVLEFARIADDGKAQSYSRGVFEELSTVADNKSIVRQVLEAMQGGRNVTQQDVRNLKKEFEKERKKKAAAAGEETEEKTKKKAATSGPAEGLTYKSLDRKSTGEAISIKIHGDAVQVTVMVPWDKKTFRGFDMIGGIKAVFNDAFQSEDVETEGFEDLYKMMTAKKAEL